MFFKKIINSYVTCKNSQRHIKEKSILLSTRGGGGFIDVGLLGGNHHKINLVAGKDLQLNEGVVFLLWITSYTASLSR